jgi:hypothetical protein
VPDDGVFVLFGISLTGPGRVRVRNVELAEGRDRVVGA